MLIYRSWSDTTIIPKLFYRGLNGHAVRYELKGEAKSFDLPGALVGADLPTLQAAIGAWAA